MALIAVTAAKDSKQVYLNPKHIVAIYGRHDGTVIATTGIKSNNESGFIVVCEEDVDLVAARVADAGGGSDD